MLDACLKERFGRDFRHYEHSLRIVEQLERDGAGLNLTEQVRDGIARHSSRAPLPQTLEGRIVRVIDRVAYINHDIDDAVRAGLLREGELPARADRGARRERLGADRRARARHGRALGSARGTSCRGPQAGPAMAALRDFMFERVYLGPAVRAEHAQDRGVVRRLFEHYVEHPERLPGGRLRGSSSDAATELAAARDRLPRGDDRPLLHHGATPSCEVPQAFAR